MLLLLSQFTFTIVNNIVNGVISETIITVRRALCINKLSFNGEGTTGGLFMYQNIPRMNDQESIRRYGKMEIQCFCFSVFHLSCEGRYERVVLFMAVAFDIQALTRNAERLDSLSTVSDLIHPMIGMEFDWGDASVK